MTRMIRSLIGILVVGCCLTARPASASPVTLVDTGIGGGGPTWLLGNNGQVNQWLAAEFTVSDSFMVTSAEGWIDVISAGDLRVALYSDGGDVPGSLLYSQQLALGLGPAAWQGVSNLAWFIGPGSYWIAFEAPGATLFSGMLSPSLNPLLNEAFKHDPGGWFPSDQIQIGVRIQAETVPEPATLLLLGTGLAGVAARRRRKRT